jgi:hypothetical protein
LFVGLVAYPPCALAEDELFYRLSAAEIRGQIIGNSVTDEAHWWDYFLIDGTLKMVNAGSETIGRWDVSGDELCFIFPVRGRTATECFEIWRSKDLVDYRWDGHVVEGVLHEVGDR